MKPVIKTQTFYKNVFPIFNFQNVTGFENLLRLNSKGYKMIKQSNL